MQDLDDGVRVGRARLSALADDPVAKERPFVDDPGGRPTAVVPGQRLLEVAAALSDGATEMHARLGHLDPAERDAILELMAGQLSSIVHLWTDLVRGVVAPTQPEAPPATTDARTRSATAPTAPIGPDVDQAPFGAERGPDPDPEPEVKRIPRRRPETPAGEPWATPLRTVKVEEPEGDYEGDRLTRDELTGVFNRQAGFAALGRELDRCRRAGERFVLGYLDVDGLQTVNSVEGLRGGDELLRKVTAALRATLRSYDVIMRLGGDEFLFSLPGADMATAGLRANEFGVILAEEAPGASASVGFGELRGNDTLDEIISRAEIELVKSRRNRVRSR